MVATLNLNVGKGVLGGGPAPNNNSGKVAPKGINAIREQYPESAKLISNMQGHLSDLSSKITLRLTASDKPDPKRLSLAQSIGFTQAGVKLDAKDDGVWGQNTENALKALNQYIKTYYPKDADKIGQVITSKIAPYLMGSVQEIQKRIATNIKVIAKVFAQEGDYSRLPVDENQELDNLPDNYGDARSPLNGGRIVITSSSLQDLSTVKIALGNLFFSEQTVLPDDLQLFSAETENVNFKEENVKPEHIIEYFDAHNIAIASTGKFLALEKYRIIPDILNDVGTNLSGQWNVNLAPEQLKLIADKLNKQFDNLLQEQAQSKGLTESFVKEFYTTTLSKILITILHIPLPKEQTARLQKIWEQKLAYYQNNQANKAFNKSYYFIDAVQQLTNVIKTKPGYFQRLPTQLTQFLESKQAQKVTGGWTFGSYKKAVELFKFRSKTHLQQANQNVKTAQLIRGLVDGARNLYDRATSSSAQLDPKEFNVRTKTTYVALANNLSRQLTALQNKIIAKYKEKYPARPLTEKFLDSTLIPDSEVNSSSSGGTAGGQGGRGRQGLSGEFGSGYGGANQGGGRGGSGFGDSEESSRPNINLPPIGAKLYVQNLAQWSAQNDGPGKEILPPGGLPSLGVGNFQTERGRQQVLASFQSRQDAAEFLSIVKSMLNPALVAWENSLHQQVAQGKMTPRSLEDNMHKATGFYSNWSKILQDAISEFAPPPRRVRRW